jgi:hypothetical protein
MFQPVWLFAVLYTLCYGERSDLVQSTFSFLLTRSPCTT